MQQKEIWKDVKGYEGYYQVSNLGRVKSFDRRVYNGSGYYIKKGRILKQIISKRGYYALTLTSNDKKKICKVHQLVAIAFHNHTPCGHKLVINHIDLNKLNNNKDNLEIVTHRENSNQKHIKSTSKYVGVSWDKVNNKWNSHIKINGRGYSLGRFVCEKEASKAYKEALLLHNEGKSIQPIIDKNKHKLTSDYIGVHWSKGSKKWKSQIVINGKQKYLGLFKNELDAHLAYLKEYEKRNLI